MLRNKEDARRLVLQEWNQWSAKHLPPDRKANGTDGLVFLGFLRAERPDLLLFRDKGDKWQTVHGWLLRDRKVID